MERHLIRAMVEAIEPLDDEERRHQAAVIDWIDSGADLCRTAKPATPPEHLVSYCVLVDGDRRRVLMVDHRDAGRWLPTGGHVDPGESPVDAARREIAEELGINPGFHPSVGPAPLLVTRTVTEGVSAGHTDVSLWFVFAGDVGETLSPDDEEFDATRWWSFDDVSAGLPGRFDLNIGRFIRKLEMVSGVTPAR